MFFSSWDDFLDFLSERKKIVCMKITHSYEDITTWFSGHLRDMMELGVDIHIGLPGGTSLDLWYEYVLSHPETWRGVDLLKLRF